MNNGETNDFYQDQNLSVLCAAVDEESCKTIASMYCLKGVNAADTIIIGLLVSLLNNTVTPESEASVIDVA